MKGKEELWPGGVWILLYRRCDDIIVVAVSDTVDPPSLSRMD